MEIQFEILSFHLLNKKREPEKKKSEWKKVVILKNERKTLSNLF